MSASVDDLIRLSQLLDTALELDESGREAWLASLDGEGARLAPTLRRLLQRPSETDTADLLDRGPAFAPPSEADAPTSSFAEGDSVGPYRLLQPIGQGGMGEVWLAERADGQLKRRVALKLPTLGLRRSVLVQRFERERDVLAGLTHPHIARLYDAGLADDGQPYLALEFVEGQPITAYCDEHRLATRERVQLLLQVMGAVQYAHAHLVIHRDLKPGNVLVTSDAQAMLLDFGIAKLLQDDETQAPATELTHLGGRALTLEYAAPEQLSGEPVSIATDGWALGVLMYELLSGARPFKGTRFEVEHSIRVLEAPRPKALPADLTTIVLKALRKSPGDRYATVAAFADDLGRWLRGEPVLAQPDRIGYRLRRFVGRHRAPVAAGTLAVLALLASSAIAFWQAAEARRQADLARQEAERARQETKRATAVQDFLLELFASNSTDQANPRQAQLTTARELLDRGAARIDQAMADAPEARIGLMGQLANIYNELGLMAQASELSLRRVPLARETFGPANPHFAQVLLECAGILQEGPMRTQIPSLLNEALAVLEAAGDTKSATRGFALREQTHYWRYVSLREFLRAADDAAAFLETHHPKDANTPGMHMLAARARMATFDFEAAETRLQAALTAAKRLGGATGARSVRPMGTMGSALEQQLKYGAADEYLRGALELGRHLDGENHPETLIIKAMYASMLLDVGRRAEGEALQLEVRARLDTDDKRLDPQRRAALLGLLGRTLVSRGRPDLAIDDLRKDVDDLRLTLPNSGALAFRELQLAGAQMALGDLASARSTLALGEEHWRAFADGESTPKVDSAFAVARARLMRSAGDPGGALAWLDPARQTSRRDRLLLLVERSQALLALGRAPEAAAAAEAAWSELATLPSGLRPVDLEASTLQRLAEARMALGDAKRAANDFAQALKLRRAHDAPGSIWVAQLERKVEALSRMH